MRRLIWERFRLPVFTTYQAVEAFKIGFECEQHRAVHLNHDLYPVRIVDAAGRTLPAGESGEVIVSNLVNGGTVLLNYRLGDIATMLPEPCACGRSLPLLSFPQGRSDDLIELASGRVVHPQVIRNQFSDEPLIWEYQVVHETDLRFRISLVTAPSCERAATGDRMTAKLARLLGDGAVIEIAFVDTIDRTAGGKFRPVISRRARAATAAAERAQAPV
jgi:phenylacetate-CoA ligase